MNWDTIEGNWKKFKGNVKEQWGKLTDDDIDMIAGKRDQLVGRIQESYGITKDEAEKQEQEKDAGEFKALTDKIASSLSERVKEVRVTHRLIDSPACLVADEHDVSGNLARILKAAGQQAPDMKPILEINPKHPVVLRLRYEEAKFDDWTAVLFDQALLAEGGQLDDPATFVKRINDLMLSMSLAGK